MANWRIFASPGNRHYCSAAIFFVDLDRHLPAEEIAGVEWCSDAFVSLQKKKKKKKKENSDGAHLYFLLSSTFLWCCNFLISALEQTLSGCLLSISFDFTPFPVKLISARTGIQTNTCRCISPNGHDASNLDPMSQEIFVDKFRSWNAPVMCSWLRWTLKSIGCPSFQIFGAVQIRTKAPFP